MNQAIYLSQLLLFLLLLLLLLFCCSCSCCFCSISGCCCFVFPYSFHVLPFFGVCPLKEILHMLRAREKDSQSIWKQPAAWKGAKLRKCFKNLQYSANGKTKLRKYKPKQQLNYWSTEHNSFSLHFFAWTTNSPTQTLGRKGTQYWRLWLEQTLSLIKLRLPEDNKKNN